jgi:hypothetical protein
VIDGSVTGMYENRWPRPGPGMVLVFAVVGLIVGILVGLFNASNAHNGGEAAGRVDSNTTVTQANDALPAHFWTVVLNSFPKSSERSVVEARANQLKNEGVEDVGVLDPSRYSSLQAWAVYSGVFETQAEAKAHRDEVRGQHPDLQGAYIKSVTNDS